MDCLPQHNLQNIVQEQVHFNRFAFYVQMAI